MYLKVHLFFVSFPIGESNISHAPVLRLSETLTQCTLHPRQEVKHRINFKIANTSPQPAYLHSLMHFHTLLHGLRCSSINLLTIPIQNTTYATPQCGSVDV